MPDAQPDPPAPPEAARVPHDHVLHGIARPDPYAWMSPTDGEHPAELVEHLAAERGFYDLATRHLNSLASVLRSEMVARVPELRRSSTWSRMRFSYYTEDARDRDYGVIWRESRNDSASEATISPETAASDDDFTGSPARQVVLDVNDLDAGTGYLDVGLTIVSPDESLLAYSVDTSGDEVFTLKFRDLGTGEDLPDVVEGTGYSGAWLDGSRGFLYTVFDASWRQERVRLHRLGTAASDDVDVLVEDDRRFEVTVRRCRSEQAIVILSESRDTGESWHVDPTGADLAPRSIGGRRPGVLYRAEHVRETPGVASFLLVTDDDATEFRLVSCPLPPPGGQDHSAWVEARPHDPAERLERVDAFAGHVVTTLRRDGDRMLRVLPLDDLAGAGQEVRSRFPGGEIRLARNTWYDATAAALTDESHTQPVVHAEASLADGTVTDSHRDEVAGHDPAAYVTEVRTFPAPDGTAVPATVVRHRDTPLDGSAPALIWAYGAYEFSWEREWEEKWSSFLDRGVVFVHAHPRGGGECGRHWWLDGRLTSKQHTFDDLLAVADGLASEGLVDPDRIATRGLSAGGLLQGAVFSQRPGRWRAVLAEVPFVDVVTSMSDDSLPLTVNEWDEWGDPHVREHYDAMVAYSPYDNPPPAGGRPELLVTGAVHDTRVLVHEPAKWVARLRETDPDWSATSCLFRVELGPGSHIGASGRLDHLAYEADVAAWLLDRLAAAGGA